MSFSFSKMECMLVPGTIIIVGSSVTFATIKNDRDFSGIRKILERIDWFKNWQNSPKNSNKQIKNTFEPIVRTTEKVIGDSMVFSYTPSSDSESPINAKISFVLEPGSANWNQQEPTVLFQEDDAFSIKKWISKNHNESKDLPECGYSWSPTFNSKNLMTSEIKPKYLEQLKKFWKESKTSCNKNKMKGTEFTNSTAKDI